MNRKGDFKDNALGLILAVMGILILTFAGYKIYQNYANQDVESAKNVLNSVEARLKVLNIGESAKFIAQGPKKWRVTGWAGTDSSRPDRCSLGSCLCVCPDDKNMASSCQSKGICRVIKTGRVVVSSDSNEEKKILFADKLIEISVTKNKEEVIIREVKG